MRPIEMVGVWLQTRGGLIQERVVLELGGLEWSLPHSPWPAAGHLMGMNNIGLKGQAGIVKEGRDLIQLETTLSLKDIQ